MRTEVTAAGNEIIARAEGSTLGLSPQAMFELGEQVRRFFEVHGIELAGLVRRRIRAGARAFHIVPTTQLRFWDLVEAGEWEPNSFRIIDDYCGTGDCRFLDIGAWIGPLTLYAAQTAAHVYAFEPDPVAFRELEANLAANDGAAWHPRVTLHQCAVAPESGRATLLSRESGGDSGSTLLEIDGNTAWEVETISLDEFVAAAKLDDQRLLIKIDIEGGEYSLVPAISHLLARLDCSVFLSLHPPFLLESLGPAHNRLAAVRRRARFVLSHLRVIRGLPFRYLYHADGRRVSRLREFARAILLGRFAHEILATNRPWQ